MAGMNKKDFGTNIIKYLLSAAVACFLLYFTFRGVKWDDFLTGLRSCRWGYILISMAAGIAAFWFRGLRWREILLPIDGSISRRTTYNAINIGYIANFIFPRIGEFVRCGFITKNSRPVTGIPEDGIVRKEASYDKVLGTVVLERSWDMVSMFLVLVLLVVMIMGAFSSCSAMLQGGTGSVLGTSFTAADEDITGANADYQALEAALQQQIANMESTHPGYDEYRYQLDEINHNPYELTAYLTVLFEDYTRAEVQDALRALFERQYTLTLEEEVETRTRTETHTRTVTDPETGDTSEEEYEVEVEYDYYILNVTLKNNGLGAAIAASGLTEDQQERYEILLQTKGNRPYLFGDDIYANSSGEYLDYDIPGEALTDEKFANMIREAEKYLGMSYVWGGSTPSTGFDCSGFVCWVINNSGNGWNVGRTTANGLMSSCDIIRASEAQPGDLIFFQGTYDTAGASHVGIYVGNGMMIHCGNPISYASIETNYWQSHFYCYGRIR